MWELGSDFVIRRLALQAVPDFGGGSSFDGRIPVTASGAMQLGERWRRFESDERYWSIFDDEVIDLAVDLFGSDVVPATRNAT